MRTSCRACRRDTSWVFSGSSRKAVEKAKEMGSAAKHLIRPLRSREPRWQAPFPQAGKDGEEPQLDCFYAAKPMPWQGQTSDGKPFLPRLRGRGTAIGAPGVRRRWMRCLLPIPLLFVKNHKQSPPAFLPRHATVQKRRGFCAWGTPPPPAGGAPSGRGPGEKATGLHLWEKTGRRAKSGSGQPQKAPSPRGLPPQRVGEPSPPQPDAQIRQQSRLTILHAVVDDPVRMVPDDGIPIRRDGRRAVVIVAHVG